MGRAAMIADDAQHVLAVLLIAREGAEFARHLGRGGIGNAGHDRGERAADRAAFVAVIGNARRHQEPADIGVAEAERAVFVGELRDFLATGIAPSSPRFRARLSTAAGMLEALDVESGVSSRKVIRLREARLQAVSSRNMYSEHGFER